MKGIEQSKHAAFLTDWFIHITDYLTGIVGGLFLIWKTNKIRLTEFAAQKRANEQEGSEL